MISEINLWCAVAFLEGRKTKQMIKLWIDTALSTLSGLSVRSSLLQHQERTRRCGHCFPSDSALSCEVHCPRRLIQANPALLIEALCRWTNKSLEGATLRGLDLHDGQLQNCNLTGVDLEGTDLEGADLRCCPLPHTPIGVPIAPSRLALFVAVMSPKTVCDAHPHTVVSGMRSTILSWLPQRGGSRGRG